MKTKKTKYYDQTIGDLPLLDYYVGWRKKPRSLIRKIESESYATPSFLESIARQILRFAEDWQNTLEGLELDLRNIATCKLRPLPKLNRREMTVFSNFAPNDWDRRLNKACRDEELAKTDETRRQAIQHAMKVIYLDMVLPMEFLGNTMLLLADKLRLENSAKTVSKKTKKNRGRPPGTRKRDLEKDKKLVAEFDQFAEEYGRKRDPFCESKGICVYDLELAQASVRRHSKKSTKNRR